MIPTILYFMYLIVSMLVLTPFGFLTAVLSLLGLKKPAAWAMYRIAQGWALLLTKATGCSITVMGRENIPRSGGICFACNHGSIFDIALLLAYAGRPFGFIAKKELLLIPFLNMWILILGGLFIDRKNARKAIRTINTGVRRIKSGGAMLIFPEGHRSRGQGLLPFHPGSFKLATQAGAVIVPVALARTWDVFEKNRRVTAVPVKVVFGKPVNTTDIPAADRKQILSDKIFKIISEALRE
jgi:1-acyl-sn-glycerol-3-phosphate acyltransferase